jgi:hypothetical protein
MVVTADPQGDFNATSQILRYSALAREVTVPRIPSVTSTILNNASTTLRPTSSGRTTPSAVLEELEAANAEIARLNQEIEVFALRLTEETARRKAAEQSWAAAEEHMVDLEAEIRDECFADMEAAVSQERRRWQSAWDEEADNNQAHLDSKIDVVIKATKAQMREQGSVDVYEESEKERADELERENEVLRAKLEALERTEQARSASPVKKMRVLKSKKWADPEASVLGRSLMDSD